MPIERGDGRYPLYVSFALATAFLLFVALIARTTSQKRVEKLRNDLLDDVLPSARTSQLEASESEDPWGLRWADVTNLTAESASKRPSARRSKDREKAEV